MVVAFGSLDLVSLLRARWQTPASTHTALRGWREWGRRRGELSARCATSYMQQTELSWQLCRPLWLRLRYGAPVYTCHPHALVHNKPLGRFIKYLQCCSIACQWVIHVLLMDWCPFFTESRSSGSARRMPDLHDVPYDTPPTSGQSSSSKLIEEVEQEAREAEPIYQNSHSKSSAKSGDQCRIYTWDDCYFAQNLLFCGLWTHCYVSLLSSLPFSPLYD